MHPALANDRAFIDRLRVHHLDLTQRFITAGGTLFGIDLFVGGVMTRSYALVDGFLNAFDSWNPIVAAPLVRMQIDSLVRMSYLARAEVPAEIADYVVNGGEFRLLKDAENQKLSDARLVDLAEEFHPWVKPVYRATSGWVHFSPEHVRATWRVQPGGDGSGVLHGEIPLRAASIGSNPMEELVGAMTRATTELFGYVEIWEARKKQADGSDKT